LLNNEVVVFSVSIFIFQNWLLDLVGMVIVHFVKPI